MLRYLTAEVIKFYIEFLLIHKLNRHTMNNTIIKKDLEKHTNENEANAQTYIQNMLIHYCPTS